MSKPLGSISVDLDNKWTYLKTRAIPGWESFPSYLNVLVPRILEFLAEHQLRSTFFIVGRDAANPRDAEAIRSIAAAGHEIGNHSFSHEPWLHIHSPAHIDHEIALTEECLEGIIGKKPIGFRGPGYSLCQEMLDTLERRGYLYDSSTLPTYLGSLARSLYFRKADLTPQQRMQRRNMGGTVRDCARPIRPYAWRMSKNFLIEIPVTTLPLLRLPVHASWLLVLSTYSMTAAKLYFRTALAACRATNVPFSGILHPTDFLECADAPELSFFPGLNQPWEKKRSLLSWMVRRYAELFAPVTLSEQARALSGDSTLRILQPCFFPAAVYERPTRGTGQGRAHDQRSL